MSKEWNFALPDPKKNDYEKERFQAMSDILYTYLYSISKHNPQRYPDGTFIEDYNYIYLDKNEEKGYPRYVASKVYNELKISKSTYYRRMEILKKYQLVYEDKDEKGRRFLRIPFIQSRMILPVKTCQFFTNAQYRDSSPDDIIKLIAILKIFYYGENKYFTMRQLKQQMGYSVTNNDKVETLKNLLIILRGFNIITWTCEEIPLKNNRVEIRYHITSFNDEYNDIMDGYAKDANYNEVQDYTEEEKRKLFPIR